MSNYKILSTGNIIIADSEFMVSNFLSDDYELLPDTPIELISEPKSLTRLEFETHAQKAAELTDAEFLAALQDPNLALLWHRLSIAIRIERDSDLTQNGLASLVAAGHLTGIQVTAINDTWPQSV